MTQGASASKDADAAARERFPAIDPKGIDMSEPITQQLPGKVPAMWDKPVPVFSEEPIGVAVLDPVDPAVDPFDAETIDDEDGPDDDFEDEDDEDEDDD